MKIEDFVNSRSTEYMSTFHPEKAPKKTSTLDKISKFLFQPRYEVNNLKFKSIAVA